MQDETVGTIYSQMWQIVDPEPFIFSEITIKEYENPSLGLIARAKDIESNSDGTKFTLVMDGLQAFGDFVDMQLKTEIHLAITEEEVGVRKVKGEIVFWSEGFMGMNVFTIDAEVIKEQYIYDTI